MIMAFGLMLVSFAGFAQLPIALVNYDVTSNRTWFNDSIYLMVGEILVNNNATLTIEPGTIIKGQTGAQTRLVVTRDGYINAQGTPEQPIVFTSNAAPGARKRADWSGIAICGEANTNLKDAGGNSILGTLECANAGNLSAYQYGNTTGTNTDDSSGVLSYVRIEYAGQICGTNTELNSLTLGGVGSKTKIDHVMVSFGQDDGFEWFGGTVGGSHLISFGLRDDDFDTDFGFGGKIQYGLVVRVDTIFDTGDRSNAFESDNDAAPTFNTPLTAAVFSNITILGPADSTTEAVSSIFGWGARLRRNTNQSIFNSLFLGYRTGFRIENTGTQNAATAGALEFRHNVFAGSVIANGEDAFANAYIADPTNAITAYAGNANDSVRMVNPFAYPWPDYTLQANSPVLTGANYSSGKLAGFQTPAYRGAFGTEDWTACWATFDPNSEDYTNGINYTVPASITASGATTFCDGGDVTLTANTSAAGATFRWSNGATTQAITVTASGNYTVTVTSERGCTATASQSVTVNSNPAAPTITPTGTAFCTGGSVDLASSTANAYAWSNGATTQTVNITLAGTYRVTVTDVNTCTAESNQIVITENTPTVPTVTAGGSTTFCTGDSVVLTVDNAGQYNAFSWSNTATTSSITVFATGTFTVTTTDANSCTASSTPITTSVSASPQPTVTVTGSLSFCEGDTVTLTSSTGDTYLWSNGATTQSVEITASGSYTVSVTNSNVCLGTGTSAATVVTVTPLPTAGFTSATAGFGYVFDFSNTSTGGATDYLWDFGDGNTSTLATPSHTYTTNGAYTVTLTASNGNCSDVSTATINADGVGIADVTPAVQAIRLYPNPTASNTTLELTLSENKDVTITVVDITGKQHINFVQELNTGTNLVSLNTSELAGGIYFVTINDSVVNKVVKLVVSK
jgi:PKD repeat protein